MIHVRLAALAALVLAPAAAAQIVSLKQFKMDGLQSVPPKNTHAAGVGYVTVDTSTNKVSYIVGWDNLLGMETFSHMHGPALAGANAAVILTLGNGPTVDPKSGTQQVTAQQVADLLAGKWYADVHTNMFPGGEIRGQVDPTVLTWVLQNQGLKGTDNKVPRISGEGTMTANSGNKITISNAKANSMGILYLGAKEVNLPFKGGTLIPSPDQTVMFTTDAQGKFVHTLHLPAGVPKYTNQYWQAWIKDAAAVKGFSASPSLASTAQ